MPGEIGAARQMPPAPAIVAIIPTVGRPDALRLCLDCLTRQSLRVGEAIIVHCGSDRETEAVVGDPRWAAAGLACRYLPYPVRNAAAQRNFAVESSEGEFLLLLDDDVEMEPEWAAELVRPMVADRAIGATMGRLVNQPLAPPSWWWRIYRAVVSGSRGLDPGRLVGAAMPNGFSPDAVAPVAAEWIGGGIAAVRRTAFLSVGGFAPYFSGSSPGEDLDLGYRLSRHWRVLYVPSARALHHSEPSGRSPQGEYQYQSMRSRYAILVRAFSRSRPAAVAHLLLWMLFQAVSEAAAVRHGYRHNLWTGWRGRLRGLSSCLTWDPPANRQQPALFPDRAL